MIFYPNKETLMRFGLFLVFFLFLSTLYTPHLHAQSSFTGLVRNYNGVKLNEPDQFIVGRNLVRLNARHDWKKGKVYASGDFLNSYLKGGDLFQFVLSESFVDLYFKNSELRLGKQVVSRGRANGIIMTDYLNPIDLSEFLTQDLSDLRQGLWAIRYQLDVGNHQLEWTLNPFRIRNTLPTRDGIWDFRNSEGFPATLNYIDEDLSYDLDQSNIEMMVKLRPSILLNIDLGLAYWDYPMPSYAKKPRLGATGFSIDLTESYEKSVVLSGSADYQLRDGLILKAESIWFDNRNFDIEVPSPPPPVNGLGPEYFQGLVKFYDKEHRWLKKNSFSQNMIGVDYSSGSTFVAGQFFVEMLPGKSDEIAQRSTQSSVSFLVRKDWKDGELSGRLFTRTGINVNEQWFNPEISWKPIDALQLAAGAHVFSGSKERDPYNFNLSVYRNNSFVFSRLTYSW